VFIFESDYFSIPISSSLFLTSFSSITMLYFWLTSAIHTANRASMESKDQVALIKKKKKAKKKRKCNSTSSEPDLTAAVPPTTNRPRSNSQACTSYASTSSLSE